jgi:DNA-binding transcriptional LysR family regulator
MYARHHHNKNEFILFDKSVILILMQSIPGLDSDILRAFVYVAEERNFTRAAVRVSRTQSAVSMQMRKLEAMLGQTLFHRGRGEGVELTLHGEYLLARAREMLAINDQIWSSFHMPQITGEVRLGTPDDYALRFLPSILRNFAQAHPAVQITVRCAPSSELAKAMTAGTLDLTLLSEGHEPEHTPTTLLWRGKLAWMASETDDPLRQDPLPLALANPDCAWRRAALRALDAAGRRWRIAYVSDTQTGTIAPVMAGLAVSVTAPTLLPPGVRLLRPGEGGLPELPDFSILMMVGASKNPKTVTALANFIAAGFSAQAERGGLAA